MDIEENWKGCATHTSYWLNPTRRTQREKESSFCNPSRHKVEWRVESGSEWANRASLVQNLSKIYHYNYSLFSMLYYGMACIIWSWISMQFLWFTWKTSEVTEFHTIRKHYLGFSPPSTAFCMFFSLLRLSDFLQPCGLQQAMLPCPFLSPRVCSNSCPLRQPCHSTISSSVTLSSCSQSFPASGSFPMSWLFASGQVLELQY